MYDLSILWPDLPEAAALKTVTKALLLLQALGYTVAALNFVVAGKLKHAANPFTAAVMQHLASQAPKLRILKRLTVVMDENGTNQTFTAFAADFDIVAVQPGTEKSLQSAATALDIDLISFDISKRIPFFLKHKIAGAAIQRGIRFEIAYAGAISNPDTRRWTIANAGSIIRATRGRGIVASSGTAQAAYLRAPYDVINLITVWGLAAGRARDTVDGNAKTAAVNGMLRAQSAKQAVLLDEPPRKKARSS